jgi:hypothetical protein
MRSVFVQVPLKLELVVLVDTLVVFEVRVVFAGAMCIYRSMRSLFRVGFRFSRRPMRSLRQQAGKANKRRCMSSYVRVVCHA